MPQKKVGINVETIRYYQRIGLIEEPEKPPSGYRLYSDQTVLKLHFIKQSKQLGFSLKEISNLLLFDNAKCAEIKIIVAAKLAMVDDQIKHLQSISLTLKELVNSCNDNAKQNDCPIINTILKK